MRQTTLEMERRQQEDGYDSDLEREGAAREAAGLPPREGEGSRGGGGDAASRAELEEQLATQMLLQVRVDVRLAWVFGSSPPYSYLKHGFFRNVSGHSRFFLLRRLVNVPAPHPAARRKSAVGSGVMLQVGLNNCSRKGVRRDPRLVWCAFSARQNGV